MATLPTPADLYGQAMQTIQGYGAADQAALQQSYKAALGQGMQSLVSSGESGTSVAPSMRMGFMKQYQMTLGQLNQQIMQAKLGAQQTFGLGGIQAQQSQQQLDTQRQLGLGNLAIQGTYANLAGQQMDLERQKAAWQQSAQQQVLQQNQAANQQSQSALPGTYMSPYLAAMMTPGPASQFGWG